MAVELLEEAASTAVPFALGEATFADSISAETVVCVSVRRNIDVIVGDAPLGDQLTLTSPGSPDSSGARQ
jgi:hypothetical protein